MRWANCSHTRGFPLSAWSQLPPWTTQGAEIGVLTRGAASLHLLTRDYQLCRRVHALSPEGHQPAVLWPQG